MDERERKRGKEHIRQTALGSRAGIPNSVDDAGNDPGASNGGREDGIPETADEERTEEGSQILGEVCVGALGFNCFTQCQWILLFISGSDNVQN